MTMRQTDFTIGWICALPVELAAAAEMLDTEYDDLPQPPGDTNSYTYGRVGEHNVVIAGLPSGQTGVGSAAAVAMQLEVSFTAVRFGLMVGIAGGVPSVEDVRLGDVVVSQPTAGHGGVVQYDFGKTRPDLIERTGFLNTPPTALLAALTKLKSSHLRGRGQFVQYLQQFTTRVPSFSREVAGADVLYKGDCIHDLGLQCSTCKIELVPRPDRASSMPEIHYGNIASGNQVMRDGKTRDQISKEYGGILCFEMEAAGLMNRFPCIVIRGICDYADSHKHKKWQSYASATAAAYAKDLLMVIPATRVAELPTVDAALNGSSITYNNVTFGDNNSGIQMGNSSGPITMTVDRR